MTKIWKSSLAASSLDEAYENGDTELQLAFAAGLIEETLMDLDNISRMINSGHAEASLIIVKHLQKVLGEFFVDAQTDILYN